MQARVASYNIRKSVGTDYRRNPLRVLSVLAAIDPDVVAIQEVDRRTGARATSLPREMIEQETGLRVVDLAKRPQSIGWHGNAILVRKGVGVTRRATLDLPGLEPRGAVSVDLRLPGGALRVVGVHFALLKRHRRRQVVAIVNHLATLPAMPTIVLGDFNEWSPRGRNLTGFAAGFHVHSLGDSFPSTRPIAGLDRMALSHDLRLVNGGVHRCDRSARASDHLPIWADLVAEQSATSANQDLPPPAIAPSNPP